MPVTMAGSRGGTIGVAERASWGPFVRDLLVGEVTLDALMDRTLGVATPKTVTLVVNNACNLSCRHCYLQVDRLERPQLREDEWRRTIESVLELRPELVCLSGKEVFLNDRGARLLTHVGDVVRDRSLSTRSGIITNGTRVERYREEILLAQPSYFDISLDGLRHDHDAVRGEGAFEMAWPNILWAAEHFGDHFFVNLTIQRQNAPRLLETVAFLANHGVANVELGFYIPLAYTDSSLGMTPSDLDRVFADLERLQEMRVERPVRVLLDLDVLSLDATLAFMRSSWFDADALREDLNGEVFVEYVFANGVTLEARLTPIPTGIWRSTRITPEGNYLAAEDTLDTKRYGERALGNVRDVDFDVAALHARARASGRGEELMREFHSGVLPQLIAAANDSRIESDHLLTTV